MNRLASATSPYLRQHADNPVHWWPWGEEPFAEAARRDVPVLISIGYAACHWCHVMAHESFEDEAVAAAVNSAFVAVKVDREEHPDVDAVYMTATQAMSGHGGWPMTVFTTPVGEPFYCGTYFPRTTFIGLLDAVGRAWREQRDGIRRQGAAVVEAIARAQGARLVPRPGSITTTLLDGAATALGRDFDEVHGGFGGAPKFPPHMVLLFLLRHHERTGDTTSLELSRHTAESMARGGIYDQLCGGFARYSVDERWLVPHFEKMLYDNALLLRVYTHLARITGDPLALRVAQETAAFLIRDLHDGTGFVSSLDADTAGVEGATYVWTPAQLRDVLGADDGDFAADLFGVTASGTFEHGTSVLRLARDVDSEPSAEVAQRYQRVRAALAEARTARAQPARDDKVVAAWCGMAITALAELAAISPPDRAASLLEPALAAARLLATVHLVDGRLRRVSLAGVAGAPMAVLEDYGCVAEAFCALHQLTGESEWLALAGTLLDAALDHFGDGKGGFFDTADDAQRLVARPADPTDNATPSGLSAVVAALVTYTALTGLTSYREAGQRALETVAAIVDTHPRYTGYAAAAAEAVLSGPYEIAIATPSPAAGAPLLEAARRLAPPGAVVVSGPPDAAGIPLLADRPLLGGLPTAYVCRGFVCDRPVTTVDELTAILRPHP